MALSSQARGTWLAAAGILTLTPDTLLVRLIDADPWILLAWRGSLMALTALLGWWLIGRQAPWQALARIGRQGWASGIAFGLGSVCFILSLAHTSVANTLVIISSGSLFGALLSRSFLGEPVPGRTWAAIAAATVGIAILVFGGTDSDGSGQGNWLGDVIAVGAALLIAIHFVILRAGAGRISSTPVVAVGGLTCTAVGLAVALATGVRPLLPAPDVLPLVLVYGLVVLPLSFALISAAPRYIPAAEVSLIMLAEAVIGPFWVWLAVDEVPATATFIGGAVVLVTLLLHGLAGYRAEQRRRAASIR
ncbi:DMT family transporter [Tistrella bauzanensis]|uniref:DMT family transporter n=1 Tax=Tistrella TaxID=171436 RepID=UPI0031F6A800